MSRSMRLVASGSKLSCCSRRSRWWAESSSGKSVPTAIFAGTAIKTDLFHSMNESFAWNVRGREFAGRLIGDVHDQSDGAFADASAMSGDNECDRVDVFGRVGSNASREALAGRFDGGSLGGKHLTGDRKALQEADGLS